MIDYSAVPIVAVLAIIAAFTDFFSGKIPHRLIKWGLISAGIFNIFLIVWVLAGGKSDSISLVGKDSIQLYYFYAAVNFALAFLLGFILWWFGMWSAGDAKLFAVLALILPLSFYRDTYLNIFPSFALFFNVFLATFIILSVEFLYKSLGTVIKVIKQHEVRLKLFQISKHARKNVLNILTLFVAFFFFFMAMHICRDLMRSVIETFEKFNKPLMYMILFFLFAPIRKLLRYRFFLYTFVFFTLGYMYYALFMDKTGEALNEFYNISGLVVLLILFRSLYDYYTSRSDYAVIPVREIRPRQQLSANSLQDLISIEALQEPLKDYSGSLLEEEHACAIREYFEKHDQDKTVEVMRTIPFAPNILLGLILTIIMKGYVVTI
jgi:preflagellin peptidase FlaK